MKKVQKCNKANFATKEDAVKKISDIKETDRGTKIKPRRSYYCKICQCFHLTSMTKKQQYSLKVKLDYSQELRKEIIKKEIEEEYYLKKFNIK
jgi:hypothetical protein